MKLRILFGYWRYIFFSIALEAVVFLPTHPPDKIPIQNREKIKTPDRGKHKKFNQIGSSHANIDTYGILFLNNFFLIPKGDTFKLVVEV